MSYVFERDEEGHWFLIPAEQKAEFQKLRDKAYKTENFEAFNEQFESMMINSPMDFVVSSPKKIA